ncbi:MAG: hypothetical protein GEU99_18900 [Luteitalea sp.]|nr:hypothetical protein [Luteitalea sp.]
MRVGSSGAATTQDADLAVEIVPHEDQRRVDITVDGKPFTSYIWPTTLTKPVLQPIHTADGVEVTRGFPPKPGERADHPHQVGLWFTFGNVNGFDFWGNSDAIPRDRRPKMGTILHKRITETESGSGEGRLGIEAVWQQGDGTDSLREETTFVVRAAPGVRMIDRLTTLTPLAGTVSMSDTANGEVAEAGKEGMLGIRVTRALEDPNETGGALTDASGNVTEVADMDNSGVTGVYTSSEGTRGKDVWGTRGRWMMLSGTLEGKPVTIAILDAPSNPGFPTYWHARGYGLFAANPLGQAVFSEGKERLNFTIEPDRPATFRYRVLIVSSQPSSKDMEERYQEWLSQKGG